MEGVQKGFEAREMEQQGVSRATTQDAQAAGKEGGRLPQQGHPWVQMAGRVLRDKDIESCKVELIFDHVGHFGR